MTAKKNLFADEEISNDPVNMLFSDETGSRAGKSPMKEAPASSRPSKHRHRISVDLDDEQYKKLRYAAFEKNTSIMNVIREYVNTL